MEDLGFFEIAVLAAVGLFVCFWIYYAIIKAATRADEQIKLLKEQNELLKKIAGGDSN